MWFNGDLAADRWVDEGFASFYAEQAVLRLGLPDHAPTLSASLMQAAIPLNDWASAGEPGTATEAYLYGASLVAARKTASLAGIDGLRQVWVQARARTSAYGRSIAPGSDLAPGGLTDWRRLLDYLEETTGKSYTAIWKLWVTTPSQSALLSTRDSARSLYAATSTAAAGWTLPPDVRQAMGGWQFDTATALLSQAQGVLAIRRQIAAAAPIEGTTPPPTLQNTFGAVGTAAAVTEAGRELAALDGLAAARQAKTDSLSAARAVGLLGTDPDAELAAARQAFADGDLTSATSLAESARSSWAGATGVGQVRILGTAAGTSGVLLLLALYVWTRSGRRKKDGLEDAGAVVEESIDV